MSDCDELTVQAMRDACCFGADCGAQIVRPGKHQCAYDPICSAATEKIERLNEEAECWRDLAEEGWGYADEYQQAKWLDKDLLDAWFPDNTERVRFYSKEADDG